MKRKQVVVVVAIGVAAAIAVVGGGYATLSGGDSTTPVTAPKPGDSTTAVEPAACKASRGRPSSDLGAVASNGPWRVRLGPGESLAPTPANVKASRRGRSLVISGRILAADCATLVAGATVHVWQANGDGDYGPSRGGDVRCCYLQGTMTTDARGRYQFQTVKPGQYGGPAHIHFQVRDQHGREVTTELLFADDPALGAQEGVEAIHLTTAGSRQHPYLLGKLDILLPSP
jgi:protocatechuate 3,4-dioxygenase beta subunit